MIERLSNFRYISKRGGIFLLLLLSCVLCRAQENQSSSLTVSLQQVNIALPAIRFYVGVKGSDGRFVEGLHAADVQAVIADQRLPFQSFVPFPASKEGVAYAFLIDVSLSSAARFAEIKRAATGWINALGDADRMELVTIGNQPVIASGFTSGKAALLEALGPMKASDDRTALYASLIRAIDSFDETSGLPTRHALVVLTDGQDDDDKTGKTPDELMAKVNQRPAPIFAVGVPPSPRTPNANESLKILAELADASSGIYSELGASTISDAFAQLRQMVQDVYVGSVQCPACPHDSRKYGFQVAVRGRTSELYDVPILPPGLQRRSSRLWIWLTAGLVVLLLLLGLATWLWKHKKSTQKEPAIPPPQPEPTPVVVSVLPVPTPVVRPRTKLTLTRIDKPQSKFDLDIVDKVVIGKGRGADVRLAEETSLGEKQCEIYRSGGLLYLRDLCDPGGIAVNGVPIHQPRMLENGEILRLGAAEYRITIRVPE